jgi:hypothetical protein
MINYGLGEIGVLQNVSIHLGLNGSKVIIHFLDGFFLVGGSHEGKRGGYMDKKSYK